MISFNNITFPNHEDLYRKLNQATTGTAAGGLTFREYTDMWLTAYKAPPKIRESSYATLKNTVMNNIVPFFGDMRLDEITPMHIQVYINSIAHLSSSVQRKCLQYVKSIFNTAIDNKLLDRSPVSSQDRVIGQPKKQEEPLTNEQAKLLLDSVKGTRAYLFVLIALSTGMRRGEILGLMWEDIDFERRRITVNHNKAFISGVNDSPVTTNLKTAAAHRNIPISDKLLEELLKEKATTESEYVIHMEDGRPLTIGSFRALWEVVDMRCITDAHEAGKHITGSRTKGARFCLDFRCHPHQLRHTFCTQCIEAGMDIKTVQKLMGHANPNITMQIYAHYREKSRAAETAEQVGAMLSYLD